MRNSFSRCSPTHWIAENRICVVMIFQKGRQDRPVPPADRIHAGSTASRDVEPETALPAGARDDFVRLERSLQAKSSGLLNERIVRFECLERRSRAAGSASRRIAAARTSGEGSEAAIFFN